MVNEDQRSKVIDLLEDAVARGRGGDRRRTRCPPGYFYRPTVLAEMPDDARILAEEVFGPVAPVTSFRDEDDVVSRANRTEHGLVAYVYTRDLRRAVTVVERLETGMVEINTGLVSNVAAPFGGVKASGFGREGGTESIEEYLSPKYVALSLG